MGRLTMEFVNVAGTATIIHQTIPFKKSFPLPLTKLLTSLPSRSATYKDSIVLTTRKKLWLINSLISVLLHPGITIFNRRPRFLKNSLLSSTFRFFSFSLSPLVVPPLLLLSTCLRLAAFCSLIAFRIRFMRDRKSVV